MDEITCPICSGPGYPMGNLGHLLWCRCRHCGSTFTSEPEETPEVEQSSDEEEEEGSHVGSGA